MQTCDKALDSAKVGCEGLDGNEREARESVFKRKLVGSIKISRNVEIILSIEMVILNHIRLEQFVCNQIIFN
jgi:hypothetical protein